MERIIFGDFSIHFHNIDSKNEMKEILRREYDMYLFLPEPEYYEQALIIHCASVNQSRKIGIGVLTDALIDILSVCVLENLKCVAISYGKYLSVVDLQKENVSFSRVFDYPIVFVKQHDRFLIVITELSVYVLKADGNIFQQYCFDDQLQRYSFEDNFLVCQTASTDRKIPLFSCR